MVRQGISSVSFRNVPAEDIIAAAREAGLEGIEWSADTHAPTGDFKKAEKLLMATLRGGLTISAYGSFFRLIDGAETGPVLETARRLQASTVRIWAGPEGVPVPQDVARKLADASGKWGITVCIEPHSKSAVADYRTLFSLVAGIDHPFFKACWAPLPLIDKDGVAEGAMDLVHLLHARNWSPAFSRLPLADAQPCLELIVAALCEKSRNAALDYWANIEYLDEENPKSLHREAGSLGALVDRYRLATPTRPKEA